MLHELQQTNQHLTISNLKMARKAICVKTIGKCNIVIWIILSKWFHAHAKTCLNSLVFYTTVYNRWCRQHCCCCCCCYCHLYVRFYCSMPPAFHKMLLVLSTDYPESTQTQHKWLANHFCMLNLIIDKMPRPLWMNKKGRSSQIIRQWIDKNHHAIISNTKNGRKKN